MTLFLNCAGAVAAALIVATPHVAQAACTPAAGDAAAVEGAVRGLFEALRQDDMVAVQQLTTPEFYAFDVGTRYTVPELIELLRQTRAAGMQFNWNVGPVDVHPGCGMAWASWENEGSVGTAGQLIPMRWLESAVLEQGADGSWKIAFFHSTRAKDQSRPGRPVAGVGERFRAARGRSALVTSDTRPHYERRSQGRRSWP